MFADLDKLSARVIGVSTDSLESHRQFAANHNLQFPLISDANDEIASRYGVSKRGDYLARVTFIIGKDGKIAHVFPKVNPGEHASEVLAILQTMSE